MPIVMVFVLSLLACLPLAAQPLGLENALAKPILAENQPLVEVQVYTASHVKSMPPVSTAQQWTQMKTQLRQQVLNEVVLNQILVAAPDDQLTEDLARRLQDDGLCWCGTTTWKGRRAIRISVSSWATTREDADLTVHAFRSAARAVGIA